MSGRAIVTVATLKGGSGKSTLASCLAVHTALNGPPIPPWSTPIPSVPWPASSNGPRRWAVRTGHRD